MKTNLMWLLVIAISAVSATRYGRIIGKSAHGETPMDISLDTDRMIAIPGTPKPMLPNFIHTVNYHDYITGFAAHKHIDGKACYIRETNETYIEGKAVLDDVILGQDKYVNQVDIFTVRSRYPLTHLREIAGLGIEEFCQGYTPFYLTVKGFGGKRDLNALEDQAIECKDTVIHINTNVQNTLLAQ